MGYISPAKGFFSIDEHVAREARIHLCRLWGLMLNGSTG